MKNLIRILFVSALFTSYVYADVAVIVNPSNSSDISEEDVKKIYLGKTKSFSNGESVEAINIEEGAVRDDFDSKLLKKNASQLKAYWSKLIFTGKATPPESVNNEAAALKKVASNANAIGYVDAGSVDDSVKVVVTIK